MHDYLWMYDSNEEARSPPLVFHCLAVTFDICLNVGITDALLCICQLGVAASDIDGEALAPTNSCLLLQQKE